MVIVVFFMVISVNRRLFRYFGSYSGISVIPVNPVRMVWGFTHENMAAPIVYVIFGGRRVY